MARFNQFSGRSGEQKTRVAENHKARVASLAVLGTLGCITKKDCAAAERSLGFRWNNGRSFGSTVGHFPGKHS